MELVNEQDLEFRHGDHGPKYLFRGPQIEWGIVVLQPGQDLGRHCHNEVEEHFHFLAGTPLMIVEGKEYRVRVGDTFRLTAPECHDIRNDTDEDVRLIFIKSPYLPNDKVDLK